MGRNIPKAVKERAFKLWLQGESYRKICAETGMSLGALSDQINELRGRVPDLDQLRELNVVLIGGGSTVFDAMRGGRLLEQLGLLGVSLRELEDCVKLAKRISSGGEAEAERLVSSALKLMRLEGETGKAYGQVVEDFEEKQSQLKGLEESKSHLEKEVQELEMRLTQTKADLAHKVQELKQAITLKERLERLGLEKVNTLAGFINDYEALSFSHEEVQRLAEWRTSLKEMGIDPDKLGEHIRKRGSLNRQLNKLRKKVKREEELVKSLKDEYTHLSERLSSLLGRILNLSELKRVLEEGRITLYCRNCGRIGVPMILPSLEATEEAIRKGLVIEGRCIFCGRWSSYTPWDISWAIARLTLPTSTRIPRS
jgi:DNA repair exonuclease SbcCD ATPase subunit